MPIEIKELIIRATVQDETADASGAKEQSPHTATDTNRSREERIVSRCVEQVLDIIRIQKER